LAGWARDESVAQRHRHSVRAAGAARNRSGRRGTWRRRDGCVGSGTPTTAV